MKQNKLAWFWLLALVGLLTVGVMGKVNQSSPSPESFIPSTKEPIILTVSAAASLQDAIAALDPVFESTHPNIGVNYNFAASGTLQQQIEQGAKVDLFISAASKQMDRLEAKNLIDKDSRRNLLSNRLALIVPQNSTLNIKTFEQLADAQVRRIAMGEPRSVPAGQYAEEVFLNLGILPQLQPKFVYGNSVRSVLSAVESGNADAGIVYATDAQISKRVKTVTMAPPNSHAPIVYPIAVIKASDHPDAAHTYAAFLASPAAQNAFSQYGFGPGQ
ncbi:molybdate ABC transporter substrate-binding protein [Synechocystis sp. LEGE 06083]|uniref:molybdate ABC transporter substrate-binding protein n=1 Tax=Synechocystis sp. LEGE 06083 TaxID=915336 RepID=UPI00187E5EC7|nr:molybdate ABC transporter substrate-binding protein [Synechocystis sp. LEGE 06083]MBE9196948.1 molybdate ABC transporter substrate-binding protein [Synechocystis sp. LEGE 06083]